MMSRKLLVSIHLYLAAFFAPMVMIMAMSGGLYLFGIKGQMNYQPVAEVAAPEWSQQSDERQQQVKALLQSQQLDSDFEYLKIKGDQWYTRPTSRDHFRLQLQDARVAISRAEPDLQAMVMELHKGHGPGWFKWFEKLFAASLVFIMVSGLLLGLQSPMLKNKTLALSAGGLLVFLLLALV